MSPYIIAIVAVVVVLVVGIAGVEALALRRQGEVEGEDGGAGAFQVEPKPYFFSTAENKLYGNLCEACRDLDLLVFPKVGLNDIFVDKKGADRKQYFRYAQLHVDYLLVTAKDYRPVAGIELDGASHSGATQKARDQKKNDVFKAAGLPLVRFYNHVSPTPDAIREKLQDVLVVDRDLAASRQASN